MTPYTRFSLAAMIMLLVFLIGALRATAFEIPSTYRGDEIGAFLVQDERDNGPPQLCFAISAMLEKLTAVDPDAKIFKHTSSQDNSSAIIAEFSNGGGALMLIESNEMICEAMPLSPMQLLIGKQSAADDPTITSKQLWPKEKTS